MPSNSGSPEPPRECPPGVHSMFDPCPGDCGSALPDLEERALRRPRAVSMTEFKAAVRKAMGGAEFNPEPPDDADFITNLIRQTPEEHDRIADGEPYCFRCGKPASSFAEYREGARAGHLASARDYVCEEEGTYNDVTNRFACDACYIAIGMPVGPLGVGWKAP